LIGRRGGVRTWLASWLSSSIDHGWKGKGMRAGHPRRQRELCTVLRIDTEETEVGDDERVPPVSGRKRRKQGGLAASSRFT